MFGLSALFLVFWPFLASLISYYIGRRDKHQRDMFVMVATVLEFIVMVSLFSVMSNNNPPEYVLGNFSGFGLHFKLDGFRYLYGVITSFMFMISALFGKEYFSSHYRDRNRYHFFYLMTLGATMAVFLSASLYTLFIFFEIMSFTSFVWVIHDETPKAVRAARTYLFIGIIGGMMMLIGIFLFYHYLGTLEISALLPALENYNGSLTPIYVAAVSMLVGFGGKAGAFLLHFWLPAAHPIAPAPASALLSGILTKTGIFGILILSSSLLLYNYNWGMLILLIGTGGMLIGALRGIFSIDLKKTLALSSVSQIGFIMVGIGMQNILGSHNAIAVRGTFLHMVNHSLLKLLLFNLAGAIYMKVHSLDLNDLRGYGRGKPMLGIMFLMGALSIGGFPLWSGYISKTLLHEAIVEQIWLFTEYTMAARFFQVIEAIFILSGGFTVAYMTKLFVCIFIEKHPTRQEEYNRLNGSYMTNFSKIVLAIPAAMVFLFGAFPSFYDRIADIAQVFMHGHAPEHAVEYFAWINIRGTLMSIIIGFIVYFMVIRPSLMVKNEEGILIYREYWPARLDIGELVFIPLIGNVLPAMGSFFFRILDFIPVLLGRLLPTLGTFFSNLIDATPLLLGRLFPFLGSFIGRLLSGTPERFGTSFYKTYKNIDRGYHKPLATEPNLPDQPDEEVSGIDMIISSSLSFSLIQFAGGIVFVAIVVFLISWLS